jgi:hypothetical protein
VTNVWAELGIPPTADPAAIRKAYAAKLRDIDQDKDAPAFMALRHAFTEALRLTQSAPPPVVLPPDAPARPRDPQALQDEARIAALLRDFAAAEIAGAPKTAWTAYRQLHALGAGDTPAGGAIGISALALRMATLVANDPATPTADVNRILQELGLDAMALDRFKALRPVAALIAICNQRLAADIWLAAIEKRAKGNAWTRDRPHVEVARFILGRRTRAFGLHNVALTRELDKYDQHRRYLPLDAARLDRARALFARPLYRYSHRILKFSLYFGLAAAGFLRALLTSN